MPRAITHYLFSQDCLDNLNHIEIKNIIKNNMDLYILGSQGPDFFTYYNKIPIFCNKNFSNISNLIHNKNINLFFKNMIFYSVDNSCIKEIFKDSNFNEITIAYLYGFLTHYILDKTIHPYIFNLQYKLKDQYKFKNSMSLHKSIETHIDCILLYKFKNIEPYKCKNYATFKLSTTEFLIISDMYKFLIKNTFNKSINYNDVYKCISTFKRTENFLNTSTNFYSKPYLHIKNLFCENKNLDSMVYLDHKVCVNDLINISNSKWKDPFSKNIYTKSLLDLYYESINSFIYISNLLNLYIDNKITINDFLVKINNCSFLTNQNFKLFDN